VSAFAGAGLPNAGQPEADRRRYCVRLSVPGPVTLMSVIAAPYLQFGARAVVVPAVPFEAAQLTRLKNHRYVIAAGATNVKDSGVQFVPSAVGYRIAPPSSVPFVNPYGEAMSLLT